MKTKMILVLAVLVLGIFLIGCGQKVGSDGYATYGQQQGQQNQYVGGGCGVAPDSEYADASGAFESSKPNF